MYMPKEIHSLVIGKFENLPYMERGIKITEDLIITTMVLLNNCEDRTLPQNSRKEMPQKTPFGLDWLIKTNLPTTQMTATIISDVLAEKGIVDVIEFENKKAGQKIKATKLLDEFTW